MDAQAALAAIAAIQEQLDDLKAYVLSQQAVKGTAVATLGSMTAKATGTVRTGKPAAGNASARVTSTGTIWNEPMAWESGVMQRDMTR
jgi:hypothetical protein